MKRVSCVTRQLSNLNDEVRHVRAVGGVNVSSENSLGYCVPTNSSANEVIAGLARASATRDSGHASNHVTAIAAGSAVGAAVLLLILMAVAISVFVRRRRRERLAGSAELASFRSLQVVRPSQSAHIFCTTVLCQRILCCPLCTPL